MKKIRLSIGLYASVDDEDFERLSRFVWYALCSGKKVKTWYAYAMTRKYGKRKSIALHREVFQKYDNDILIDHIDHDGLNNQKSNLRIADRCQNQWNKSKNFNSKYKGVHRTRKRWRAKIEKSGRQYHCGSFDSQEEAAVAYDLKAVQLFGEYAYLNFPALHPQPQGGKG